MFAFWIGLPLALRLGLVCVVGLIGGAWANHAIYSWCWFPRPISPWAAGPQLALTSTWADRLPLVGWLRLRRESATYGRLFWLRPLLIELALAIGLPLLYWYECELGGLLPIVGRVPAMLVAHAGWLNVLFARHAILVVLMMAATFIDFDEQTIPDIITIPGTIIALVLATLSLGGLLPALTPAGLVPASFSWPAPIDPVWFTTTGLWTALGIWSGWCFALADRRLILRRGYWKAIEFFFAGLVREPAWKVLLAFWVVGLIVISIVFGVAGPGPNAPWLGLFSALVGLAIGGGVVWAVRIVASSAMGVEAMGFGDVTLMAMIGAFVGWQASLAAFFLAPIAAIAIVIVQYVITREPRVPFGPYLCAGTLLTIVFWDSIANRWMLPNLLVLGPLLVWLLPLLFLTLGATLLIWRQIKQRLLGF